MTFRRIYNLDSTKVSSVNWSNPLTNNLSVAILPYAVFTAKGPTYGYPNDSTVSIQAGRWGPYIKINAQSTASGIRVPHVPLALQMNMGDKGSSALVVTRGVTGGGASPTFFGSTDVGYGYTNTGVPSIRASHGWVRSSTETMNTSSLYTISYGYKASAGTDAVYIGVNNVFNTWTSSGTGGTNAGDLNLYGKGNISGYSHPQHEIYLLLMFDKLLPLVQAVELAKNPWSIFNTTKVPIFVDIPETVSVYRPASDISVADWIATPSAPLFDCINEEIASNTDYITSPNSPTPASAVLGFSNTVPSGTWDIRIMARSLISPKTITIVMLDDTNSVQGTSTSEAPILNAYEEYVLSVTTTGPSSRFRIELT